MKARMSLLARLRVPETPPVPTITLGLASIAFAFIALIAGATAAFIWLGDRDFTELAGWTVGAVLIVAFVRQTHRRAPEALRLMPSNTPVVFVMFVALGAAIGLDLISLAVTGEFLPKPELLGLNPSTLGALEWIFAFAFMVLAQPVAEGLVFRGVALPALRSALGVWGGVLATALITGAFHLLIYPPNYSTTASLTPIWYGLIVPIIEAIFFSLVRSYAQSTRASIAAHVAFGVFAIIKLLAVA